MTSLGIDLSEMESLAKDMAGSFQRFTERAVPLVTHWGQLLEARWKANAATGYHAPGAPHIPGTGPGPNVGTGDFVRSIGPAEIVSTGVEVSSSVGSNAAQAARLEWGFVGADALERVYNQPPYPSAGPALDWITPQFETAVAAEGFAVVIA